MAARNRAETASARLFLALWPPVALCDAVARHASLWRWPAGARKVPPEHWHITLHFIGSVPLARIAELEPGLAVPFEPFELELGRAEVWPGGIAVLGSTQVPEALYRLHADLGRALRTLALPVETRAFRPHLTLARQAQGAVPAPVAAPLRWRADQGYRLVRSLPGGGGYQALHRFGTARIGSPGSPPPRG